MRAQAGMSVFQIGIRIKCDTTAQLTKSWVYIKQIIFFFTLSTCFLIYSPSSIHQGFVVGAVVCC
jgi:hypothetical protein